MKKLLYYSPYYPLIGLVIMILASPLKLEEKDFISNDDTHASLSIGVQFISLILAIVYIIGSIIIFCNIQYCN